VLEVRPSKSGPEQGLIKIRTTTLNQHAEAVLVHVLNLVVPAGRTFGSSNDCRLTMQDSLRPALVNAHGSGDYLKFSHFSIM
jgi:hypothetical protein